MYSFTLSTVIWIYNKPKLDLCLYTNGYRKKQERFTPSQCQSKQVVCFLFYLLHRKHLHDVTHNYRKWLKCNKSVCLQHSPSQMLKRLLHKANGTHTQSRFLTKIELRARRASHLLSKLKQTNWNIFQLTKTSSVWHFLFVCLTETGNEHWMSKNNSATCMLILNMLLKLFKLH